VGQWYPNAGQIRRQGGPLVDSRDLQSISFYFQKIDITSISGGTEAMDDWQAIV
jgi:hypothetical protein